MREKYFSDSYAKTMGQLLSRVTPAHQELLDDEIKLSRYGKAEERAGKMYLILLHILFKRYGAQRHPELDTFETLMKDGALTELAYVPPQSTIIYISHEWARDNHPDPRGDQIYHLLLLLERLRRGDVDRTDMDAFHSLVYKQNYTTTAEEWKRTLNMQTTYIFYDGLCVQNENREQGFRIVPEYVKRCDFMIILAPGCTHFDRIDPRTERKKNLCYRTYRLRAKCVYDMFCSFLTTKVGEQVRPALLVRSGTGTPNWISPLECLKLAVGTSVFACCETNHTIIHECQKSVVRSSLNNMVMRRADALFDVNEYALARCHKTLRMWWLRELQTKHDCESRPSSLDLFLKYLRWNNITDGE